MPDDLNAVRRRFEAALDAFVDLLEQDRTIVAAILWGSLAYDHVWEGSDIDVMVVRDDQKARSSGRFVPLTSHGVNIHAFVVTRAEFKRRLQSAAAGGFWHSTNTRGRILFTRDEAVRRIFDEIQALGERDRRGRLLEAAAYAAYHLDKAEKFVQTRRDAHYAALWVGRALQPLAEIEMLLHKQVPDREALLDALELNAELFGRIHTQFADTPKTPQVVRDALDRIYAYLSEHLDDIYGPLLEYLEGEGTVRSVTDIQQHFERQMDVRAVAAVCEWLAAKGVLVKASAPYFLTEHSRVEFDQLAFLLPER